MPRPKQPLRTAELLASAPVLKGLPAEAIRYLDRSGRRRHFAAGRVLMRQGDPSDSLHVILSGRVSLERAHPHLLERISLAELGPGEVVGEMGVLDNEPRSATVIALEDTTTLEIDAATLQETLKRYPQVRTSLLRMLSRRLRRANHFAEHYLRRVDN